MRIAIDAMGGDNAPDEIVRGAVLYGRSGGRADLILVGDETRLRASGLEVVHAPEVVGMGEHPSSALRRRSETSIAVATQLVKDGRADAVVSAGNTGATMAAALLILGRVRGIDRPALCGLLPTTRGGPACLLDAGATMDATAENLLQFARMASRFMERVHALDRPSVGLLNVGEEPEKGDRLHLEAHALLSGAGDLNFYGNVEGRDILRGVTDVVVADGFTGNCVAKAMEGALDVITEGIRKDIFGGALGKVAGAVAYPGIRAFRRRMDYEPYVSAPLLGVNGVSVVTHGRARARMLKLAIDVAERSVASGLIGAIAESAAA